MWKTISLVVLLIVQCSISSCASATKIWLPNFDWRNFNELMENQEKTCIHEVAVFPRNLFAVVTIPKIHAVKEIILSDNGGLIFQNDMLFIIYSKHENLDGRPEKVLECGTANEATFKRPILEPWLLSRNWGTPDVRENNSAIPHQERIPCQYDVVEFPFNHSFIVDLQFLSSLTLQGITLNGLNKPVAELHNFFMTRLGQIMFVNSDITLTAEASCHDPNQCECQKDDVFQLLCENERKYCETPKCLHSIRPIGHCCDICGASLVMKLKEGGKPNLSKLRGQILKQLRMNNIDDEGIEYHVSFINGQLQLVIVDKLIYAGISVQVMEMIKTTVFDKLFRDNYKQLYKSGQPYSPHQKVHIFGIMFGTLISILSMFSITYNYYYNNERLHNWISYARTRNPFSSPIIFARFDNTPGARGNEAERLAVGIEYNDDSNIQNLSSGFNNPMFEDTVRDDLKSPEITEPVDTNSYVEVELM